MLNPVGASSLPEGLRKLADSLLEAYPKQQDYIAPYVYAFYLRERITEEDQASILPYLRWGEGTDDWRRIMADDPARKYLPSAAKFLERWKRWRGNEAAQEAFEGGGAGSQFAYDFQFRPERLVGTEDFLRHRRYYGRYNVFIEDWEAELARRQADGEPMPDIPEGPEEGKAEAAAPAGRPDLKAFAEGKSVDGAIKAAAEAKNASAKAAPGKKG